MKIFDLKDQAGIYCIRNHNSGKLYIGYSFNIRERISQHLRQLRDNKHPNKQLQDDFLKDGISVFKYSILKEFNDIVDENDLLLLLKEQEREMLKQFSKELLYNINLGLSGDSINISLKEDWRDDLDLLKEKLKATSYSEVVRCALTFLKLEK